MMPYPPPARTIKGSTAWYEGIRGTAIKLRARRRSPATVTGFIPSFDAISPAGRANSTNDRFNKKNACTARAVLT